MRRQKIRAPTFPVAKDIVEDTLFRTTTQPSEEFRRGRRRSGTRVEQRNLDFPRRECRIHHGKISDHHAQECKAHARFHYRQHTGGRVIRGDVAVAQREKRLAAVIEQCPKRDMGAGSL